MLLLLRVQYLGCGVGERAVKERRLALEITHGEDVDRQHTRPQRPLISAQLQETGCDVCEEIRQVHAKNMQLLHSNDWYCSDSLVMSTSVAPPRMLDDWRIMR